MKRKDKIKALVIEIKIKDLEILERDKKIEILQFIVEYGKHPVVISNTGIKECNGEKYQIKYINTFGDIYHTDIGYFDNPTFQIKSNDNLQCILMVKENSMERWYKLFKDRKIIVEIPKPLEWAI